ncbi:hypothetical protein GCM10007898_18680 [Dyella flagellata]|uniref:Uncharacterized protein n=1 Tax=Dyella flagellata TaxID=1867833 RepID=A0ABQ5XAL2_9GAMM|nr:hypothetical protein GCM10007898_18680 [Dyella flagellata]
MHPVTYLTIDAIRWRHFLTCFLDSHENAAVRNELELNILSDADHVIDPTNRWFCHHGTGQYC